MSISPRFSGQAMPLNFSKMNTPFKYLVLSLGSCALLAAGEDLSSTESGEFVRLVRVESGITAELENEVLSGGEVISRISITPSESSPKSYIVAGTVQSNNSGGPIERCLIRIGEGAEVPVIAGMTNADGEFKFRLWIEEDARKLAVQVKEPFSAFLYVGGQVNDLENTGPQVAFGTCVRRYKLVDLQARSETDKKQ